MKNCIRVITFIQFFFNEKRDVSLHLFLDLNLLFMENTPHIRSKLRYFELQKNLIYVRSKGL